MLHYTCIAMGSFILSEYATITRYEGVDCIIDIFQETTSLDK